VNKFLEDCEHIYRRARYIADTFGRKEDSLEDNRLKKLINDFQELYDATWKVLMENEMHLHESVNETNFAFEHIIQDMMNEFIEKCKTQFVQLRELESNFIDALTEAVQSFVTLKAAIGKEHEIPDELRESLIERDIILNLATGMKDMHISKIDGREDMLINRSKEWVRDLCAKLVK
jgi:hypothetical protein